MHPIKAPQNLIIVPGHALLKDSSTAGQSLGYYQNSDNWILEDYQKTDLPFYLEHIQAGVQELAKDPQALLIFSGGRTREGGRLWSEAESYMTVAQVMSEWKMEFESRVLTEDYARDSMQNLCFSLLRYFIYTHRFPKKTKVCNWKFKEARFHFHAHTLGVSEAEFEYLPVNNFSGEFLNKIEGFEAAAFQAFEQDPFGLNGELMRKKIQRDRQNEGSPYQPLLSHFPYKTDLKKLEQSIVTLPKKENKTPFIEHPSLMRFDWSPVYDRRLA